ncbi:hypothetical protein L484_009135 [Morus notabilis]|uniref:Uncharacterized protein n=1 Tax=Morus notabilis TaxID=981085 RepID=W9RU40_9ROSA|nr:hypothetical protein L484_009135 [Morus notabilis]
MFEPAKKAYKAARKDSDHAAGMALSDEASSALADRVNAMLQKLEKEIDDVDVKIGDRWQLLDRAFSSFQHYTVTFWTTIDGNDEIAHF